MVQKSFMRLMSFVIVFTMVFPPAVFAQDPQTQQYSLFRTEELHQILSPIALYPDSLLAQILMAATYPLEVIQADRFMRSNVGLQGDRLDAALRDRDWDVSVKSLCYYPKVLQMMSEKIDWTQRLGDAFLAQQPEVMDAIQYLRQRAHSAGNLQSTREQKVIVEREIIRIEPALPDVIYIPTYNTMVVYGPWWYPAYPPYAVYYPGWYPTPGIAFGFATGIFVAALVTSWSGWDWRARHVNVNINRTYVFNRNVNINQRNIDHYQSWRHDPQHRRSVAYRDPHTSQRYGQYPNQTVQPRQQARGYEQIRGYERQRPPQPAQPQGRTDMQRPPRDGVRDDTQRPGQRPEQKPDPRPNIKPDQQKPVQTAPEVQRPSRDGVRDNIQRPDQRPPQMPEQRQEPRVQKPVQTAPEVQRQRETPRRAQDSEASSVFSGMNQGGIDNLAGERGRYSRENSAIGDRGSRGAAPAREGVGRPSGGGQFKRQ